jgi:hypothetical protein
VAPLDQGAAHAKLPRWRRANKVSGIARGFEALALAKVFDDNPDHFDKVGFKSCAYTTQLAHEESCENRY